MRSFNTFCIFVTFAAVAAAGCTREIALDEKAVEKGVHLNVLAGESVVKSELDGLKLKWTESESARLFYSDLSGSSWSATNSTASILNGDGTVSFSFVLEDDVPASIKVKGVTPATAVSGTDPAACRITVPVRQCPTSTSYDPAAMVQRASSDSINVTSGWRGAEFSPIVALNRLTLKGIVDPIYTVEIACGNALIAGTADADLTGDLSALSGDASSVTLGYYEPLVNTGNGHDIYFTSFGFTSSDITITAYTATERYTKKISKEMSFPAGAYTWYSNVNMEGCGEPNPVVGECLLAAKTGTASDPLYLMKSDFSGYNTGVLHSKDNVCADFYDVPEIEHYRWIISRMAFGYSIQNGETKKYVGEISDTDTKISLSDTPFEQMIFESPRELAFDTLYVTTNGGRYINLNDGKFKPLTTNKSCPKAIRWEDDKRPERRLAFAKESVEVPIDVTDFSNKLSGDGSLGKYSSSDTNVVTVNESTGVLTPGRAGSATITITCPGTRTVKPGTASYNVTITAEDPVITSVTTGTPDYGYENGKYYIDVPVSVTGQNISESSPAYYGCEWSTDGGTTWNWSSSYSTSENEFKGSVRIPNVEYYKTYLCRAWAGIQENTPSLTGNEKTVTVSAKGLPVEWTSETAPEGATCWCYGNISWTEKNGLYTRKKFSDEEIDWEFTISGIQYIESGYGIKVTFPLVQCSKDGTYSMYVALDDEEYGSAPDGTFEETEKGSPYSYTIEFQQHTTDAMKIRVKLADDSSNTSAVNHCLGNVKFELVKLEPEQ